jgi:hypothetical protein
MNTTRRNGLIVIVVLTLGCFGIERYFQWQSFVNGSFSLLAIHSERQWKQHRRLPESYSELLGSMPVRTREVFERPERRERFDISYDRQGDNLAVIRARDNLLPFFSRTYRVQCAGADCNFGPADHSR